MKTELKYVTPKMARDWLKKNTNNRVLRPGAVETLRAAWDRGEWKVLHQGIAFGTTGRLLDGQHRLTFISQLDEDALVPLNVTTGADEGSFAVMDQGLRRTLADIMGVSSDLSAVGRFFARIYNGGQATGITSSFTIPFIEWVTPEFQELVTFCPAKAHVFGSASVRAAAIYQMKQGHDEDFIKASYHALNHHNIEAMPNASRVLAQQFMSGKIVSARSVDLFCRALRAFDSTQTQKITKILVKDQAGTIEGVRQYLKSEASRKSPGGAGLMISKAKRNSNASALAA